MDRNARKFYVYVFLDPRKPGRFAYGDQEFTHEPFYVGKGSGKRLSAVHRKESPFLTAKLNRIAKPIKLLLCEHKTESTAIQRKQKGRLQGQKC